jgi:hypothetical protein
VERKEMEGKTEIKKVEFEDIPDYGDLMTMEEWISCVRCGCFIDYDGTGYLALENKMSREEIQPSEVSKRGFVEKTKNYTHVIWFNK